MCDVYPHKGPGAYLAVHGRREVPSPRPSPRPPGRRALPPPPTTCDQRTHTYPVQLLFFCFRVFDEDHSGHLANTEFKYLAEAINEAGGALFPGNVGTLLENFDANNDGGVDFFEFLEIDQQFPMAFFPVFRMQDTLQSRTLTPDVWINLGRSVPTGIW